MTRRGLTRVFAIGIGLGFLAGCDASEKWHSIDISGSLPPLAFTDGHPYEATHSSAIYVFDRSGTARLLVASLASTNPDLAGTAADLRRLVAEPYPSGVREWLRQPV